MEYNIQIIRNRLKYIINANQRSPKLPKTIHKNIKKMRATISNIMIIGEK